MTYFIDKNIVPVAAPGDANTAGDASARLHIDPLYLRAATLKMRGSTSCARGNVVHR